MATKKGKTTPAKATATRQAAADNTAIIAPNARVTTEWTPAQLRSVFMTAESGTLDTAVRICDWLLTDDRVVATLGARVDALLGLVPSFETSGDKRRAKRAVKALEVEEDWWTAYPAAELRQLLIWGILLGVAPARHNWKEVPGHGGRLLPMPKFWHPGTLRFDSTAQKWTTTDNAYVTHEIVPGDGEWILHLPFGSSRPWAHGLWRPLSRWALLKQFAQSDTGVAGGKAATAVATTPDGSNKKARQEFAADFIAAAGNRTVVLPPGWDLKMLELSQQTGMFYKSQVDMANEAIAILVRGGNLTTNLKEGSLAGIQTQKEAGDDAKLSFDAEALANTLNAQSLSWWAEFNFGDRGVAPWPSYPVEDEEDKSARATTTVTVFSGVQLATSLGYEVDDQVLLEKYGLDEFKPRAKAGTAPAPQPGTAPATGATPTTPIGTTPATPTPADPNAPPKVTPKGSGAAALAAVAAGQKVQDTALNGAQIDAMSSLLDMAAHGQLPRDTVVATIVTGFNVDEGEAERIVGEIGKSFVPTPTQPDQAPPQEPAPNNSGGDNGGDSNASRLGGVLALVTRGKGLAVRLASGGSVAKNKGFIEGQGNADSVTDNALEAAQAEIDATLAAIEKAIDESETYEELRARLKELYPQLDTSALNELVYRSMLLAELVGRHAVNRDA